MANTFNLGNGNWAQKTEKLLAYNAENDNYKPLPFDFDRGSTATVVNKDGLIETVGTDEPRIDFLNNTSGHLLLEPQRTNNVTYSEDFSQWDLKQGTETLNYGISPDGTKNSTRIVFASSNLQFSEFITTGASTTGSMYIKGISGETVNFGVDGSETIFTLNGNWQRFEKSGTSTSNKITVNTFGGATARDIEVYGAQLEQGSYATSYIPTSGSTATRSAEICNGAGNSNVFNDSEGVLYVETEQFTNGDFESTYISLNQDGSSTNHLTIQHRNSGQLRIYAGGFVTANIQFLENIDMAQNLKIAVQYKQNDYKLFVNGTQYFIYPSGGSQPALTGLNVVKFHLPTSVSLFWLGKVKDLKVYNTALSDSELQALTTI